jgi:molybdopterin/thiamine biosynthesis adenylyltransferase/rhodanese-related sulfurtransferase
MSLSVSEIAHYQRQLLLQGFGLEAQERLKNFSVLVIGAGGLGCPLLQYLAAAGIGRIGIVDGDKVQDHNLHRQILYTTADVGKSKSAVAAERLRNMNPNIELEELPFLFEKSNAIELLGGYDLLVDGSDNFSTRYLSNDACVILNKPLVSGAIFKYEGQVSVFNYHNGPTYRCLFPEPPLAHERPSCSEIGVLGVLPGVIGSIMAAETIKIAAQVGEPLSGKLLTYDALGCSFDTFTFSTVPENKHIKMLGQYDFDCDLESINEISCNELKNHFSEYLIVDVREKEEYALFNIGGTNIPLSELEKKIAEIPKNKHVVVHCQGGSRSRQAIQILQKNHGFRNLLNLSNGLRDW